MRNFLFIFFLFLFLSQCTQDEDDPINADDCVNNVEDPCCVDENGDPCILSAEGFIELNVTPVFEEGIPVTFENRSNHLIFENGQPASLRLDFKDLSNKVDFTLQGHISIKESGRTIGQLSDTMQVVANSEFTLDIGKGGMQSISVSWLPIGTHKSKVDRDLNISISVDTLITTENNEHVNYSGVTLSNGEEVINDTLQLPFLFYPAIVFGGTGTVSFSGDVENLGSFTLNLEPAVAFQQPCGSTHDPQMAFDVHNNSNEDYSGPLNLTVYDWANDILVYQETLSISIPSGETKNILSNYYERSAANQDMTTYFTVQLHISSSGKVLESDPILPDTFGFAKTHFEFRECLQ